MVTHCKNTKGKIQATVKEIEATLKQQVKKDDYAKIQNTLKVNETATTRSCTNGNSKSLAIEI